MEPISLDENQITAIRITSQIISGFSLSGSILIFSTFWFFKDNRSFNLELVQYYALSNFFYSASPFLPYRQKSDDTYCAIQSFVITMFQNASLVWSSIIGYSAFISIINKDHFENNRNKYRFFFIFISYLFTAGCASLIIFTKSYGDSGGWCWIKINSAEKIHKKLVLFFYVLLWFLIILNCFFIFKMNYILKRNLNEKNKNLMKKFSIMKWYPITQVICMLPATINRIYTLITDNHNFVMSILQSIFDSILGVFICVIFLLSPEMKHSLRTCFNKIFKKNYEHKNSLQNNHTDSFLDRENDDYNFDHTNRIST